MSGGKELVLETLRRATSQEAEVLKPAEQQLQQWEAEPGFYSTLVEVSLDLIMFILSPQLLLLLVVIIIIIIC